MDTTIEAALIGGGAAAGVAFVSSLVTLTVARLQLRSSREGRVWDKRSGVYEEILADVTARRVRRDHAMNTLKFDPVTEAEIRTRFTPSDDRDWYAFEGRVQAMASDWVYRAFRASHDAHLDVLGAIKAVEIQAEGNRRQAEISPSSPPLHDIGVLTGKIPALGEGAKAADDRLGELIRNDLLGRRASVRQK